jgi:hypothetical protein
VLVGVGFGGSAFASSLTTSADRAGTGTAIVTRCGQSGWSVSESSTSSAKNLTGVIVSGISSNCETTGDNLEVEATEGTSSATGSLVLVTAQTSYTVAFSSCRGGTTDKCTGETMLLTLAAVTAIAASVSGP